jgi:hypothetical protein
MHAKGGQLYPIRFIVVKQSTAASFMATCPTDSEACAAGVLFCTLIRTNTILLIQGPVQHLRQSACGSIRPVHSTYRQTGACHPSESLA